MRLCLEPQISSDRTLSIICPPMACAHRLGYLGEMIVERYPRNASGLDLAAVYGDLVAWGHFAGYQVIECFYEVGSHSGLNELDQLLRSGTLGRRPSDP